MHLFSFKAFLFALLWLFYGVSCGLDRARNFLKEDLTRTPEDLKPGHSVFKGLLNFVFVLIVILYIAKVL